MSPSLKSCKSRSTAMRQRHPGIGMRVEPGNDGIARRSRVAYRSAELWASAQPVAQVRSKESRSNPTGMGDLQIDDSFIRRCPRCGAGAGGTDEYCSACGSDLNQGDPVSAATLRAKNIRLRTERRQLTVVFCDLIDSVVLSTQVDPEDLTEILAGFHQAVAQSMREFGGFVARVMGDGALTYFGYPQAHEDDTERAVHAALRALDAVAALSLPAGRKLHVRIGIAT